MKQVQDFSQPVTYRRIERHELPRLAEFGAAMFIDTFGHLYAADDLQLFLHKVFRPEALANDLDSGRIIWIAESGGELIGYCKLGPLGLPVDVQGRKACELKQMYVRRDYHGRGIADALMQIFIDWAEYEQAEELYISCWAENHRALAFYRRYGFEIIGAYIFWVGNHADDERILKRTLDTSTS